MEHLKKKLESVQGTIDISNQSSPGADTVGRLDDELQSLSLLDERREPNPVDEHHHHHESLNVARLEDISSPKLQFNDSNEDDLNECCLLEIFSYLSIDDMIQVKRVCRKWYQASQQWFKQVQTLVYTDSDTRDSRLELYEKYYNRKIYERTRIDNFNDIILILQSCGQHIKYFKTSCCIEKKKLTEKSVEFIFQWVPKLCKNIVNVQIHGKYVSHIPWNYEVMATHWEKLKQIDIEYLCQPFEETFYNLLRNNKELKTFKLLIDSTHKCLMNYEFFSYLPTTIKEIMIENMFIKETQELSHFISASKNFISLESLKLTGFRRLTDAVVATIVDIKSLTHLWLSNVNYYESCRTIDLIANMKGLKSLYLTMNYYLNEDNVINIVESCIQLEALRINWLKITDRGMAAIAKLEKLKCLDINLKNVTNESIINSCDNLEVLCCRYSKINDCDANKLLIKATNLRFVRFNQCSNLTKDILLAANEIANERKNNVLFITVRFHMFNGEDIDTPYFRFSRYLMNTPLKIFPKNIRNHLKLLYDL